MQSPVIEVRFTQPSSTLPREPSETRWDAYWAEGSSSTRMTLIWSLSVCLKGRGCFCFTAFLSCQALPAWLDPPEAGKLGIFFRTVPISDRCLAFLSDRGRSGSRHVVDEPGGLYQMVFGLEDLAAGLSPFYIAIISSATCLSLFVDITWSFDLLLIDKMLLAPSGSYYVICCRMKLTISPA